MHSALHCSLENASLWPLGHGTLVCAHGTTILTNHEPSELVGDRIFHALQVRTQTIIPKNPVIIPPSPTLCMLALGKSGKGAYMYMWDPNISMLRILPTVKCHVVAQCLYFLLLFGG